MKLIEGVGDAGVSEEGRRGGRSEDAVVGLRHGVADEVMGRWGVLGAGLCRRHRVALAMGVDRGVVAFHDSWGSRKRGIAEVEAMLSVYGGRPLRKAIEIGSTEKIGMLGSLIPCRRSSSGCQAATLLTQTSSTESLVSNIWVRYVVAHNHIRLIKLI